MANDIALQGAQWRKSSRSNAGGAQCVEIADVGIGAAVRDSKNASGPASVFPPSAFGSFLAGLKRD
ncbi:DUF397 domain-containing protein [Saccharothrix xinjiangensis]|uniref:DUF397 domain-containing protein n=1 Tax=Saccharothrix xinjiangensis TaxID=204798 RepID=A0ABV9XT53_9PSEU